MNKKFYIGLGLLAFLLILFYLSNIFIKPSFNIDTMQTYYDTPNFWAEVIKVNEDDVLFRSHDDLEEYGIEKGIDYLVPKEGEFDEFIDSQGKPGRMYAIYFDGRLTDTYPKKVIHPYALLVQGWRDD